MFCIKCGKEIHDEAVICPNCGCSTGKNSSVAETPIGDDKASGGLIAVSILFPIVGVILGIVNLCKKKSKSGTTYLLTGIIAWVVFAALFSIV